MNANLINENSIVSNLINIYERFGFKKIKLSKFEDYNLYNNNKDFLQTEHILTFMNLNGNLKSLRPDVTLSIVKKVLKDNEKETQKIYYIEDIYKIVKILSSMQEINVIKEKDYIKNCKKSGYSAYHLIIEVPIYKEDKRVWVKVEIQIKTMAMDFWSCIEHKVKYKSSKEISKRDSKNKYPDHYASF